MDRGVSILAATIATTADGWRLDRALADAVPTLSRERLKVLIASGAVTRDGVMVRDPRQARRGGRRAVGGRPAADAAAQRSAGYPARRCL
jgi:23S rRNA pseudouridine1911/1915/1917 synthase